MAAAKGNQYAKGHPNNLGRPLVYTEAIFFEILDQYSNGCDLIPLLESKKEYPSYVTFNKWINSNDELFKLYTYARQGKTEPLIAKIHETIQRLERGEIDHATARVIIDTYKWEIGKYYPKLYGDKLDLSNNGGTFTPPTIIFKKYKNDDE